MRLSIVPAGLGLTIVAGLWGVALLWSGASGSDLVGFGGVAVLACLFAWLTAGKATEASQGQGHAQKAEQAERSLHDSHVFPRPGYEKGPLPGNAEQLAELGVSRALAGKGLERDTHETPGLVVEKVAGRFFYQEDDSPHVTQDLPTVPAAVDATPQALPIPTISRRSSRDTPDHGVVVAPVRQPVVVQAPVFDHPRRVDEPRRRRRSITPTATPSVDLAAARAERQEPRQTTRFGVVDGESQSRTRRRTLPLDEAAPASDLHSAATPTERQASTTTFARARDAGPFAWEWDLSRGDVYCSERWLAIAGPPGGDERDPEAILARLSSESRDELLRLLTAALNSPYGRVTQTLRFRGGDVSPVTLSLRAARNPEGELVRVIADLVEPVEPAAAKVGRSDTDSLLERALDRAGIAMVEVSASGQLLDTTPAVAILSKDWPSPQDWWTAVARQVESVVYETLTEIVDLCSPRGVRHVYEVTHGLSSSGSLALVRDATETARAEESLKQSEARYALAARAANDGLWDWNLRTDQVYFSERWLEMLGLVRNDADGTPGTWLGRVHPEDVDGLRDALDLHLAGRTEKVEHESRMLHRDGGYRWVLTRGVAERDGEGRAFRLAGSQSDISERKSAESKLVQDALYDPLTGLPNRALFMDVLGRAIRRHRRRPDAGFAVLFLDLDGFKLVNDSLGHLSGDELLVGFSERLKQCPRLGDTVARMGGDEFTVLLEETVEVAEATAVAERIQELLAQPFLLGDHEVYTSASIGVAMSSRTYESPEDILRDADTAMYRAKAMGKAQHAVFDSKMHAEARSLLQMHTELRHAIERSELELQYQPIIDLFTGRISGFEALVRWRHAERGLVWPDEFIPAAEESGLIEPISRWVLGHACRQTQQWRIECAEAEDIAVSVNLSSRSFAHPRIVTMVAEVLEETQLPASSLKLEVTESSIMENASSADVLDELKNLGVQLYLDDFGTGYSSLSYLQRLNVDALKIDKSFVQRVGTDDKPDDIIGAITSLAHNLGLKVIAEGVQTPAQLQRLRDLGCEFGQGYLFSRPLDPAYAHALIVEDPIWE